ncbi:hypothetical protein GAMM_190002 [Gammaproteobacteria bacterium]
MVAIIANVAIFACRMKILSTFFARSKMHHVNHHIPHRSNLGKL